MNSSKHRSSISTAMSRQHLLDQIGLSGVLSTRTEGEGTPGDGQSMLGRRSLTRAWLLLLGLTLLTAMVAETMPPTTVVILAVCLSVAIKGHLVIERLVGLKGCRSGFRTMLLSYFYLVPLLIAVALVYPEVLVMMTTL